MPEQESRKEVKEWRVHTPNQMPSVIRKCIHLHTIFLIRIMFKISMDKGLVLVMILDGDFFGLVTISA
jgi:hypothetical protein